jgi:hypothetical protein
MAKHEFYADPTVFDQWHSSTGNWLSRLTDRFCPFAWGACFAALGITFLSIAIGVASNSLHQSLVGVSPPDWSSSLAQTVTALIALFASQNLLVQAANAWPDHVDIPNGLRVLASLVGWRDNAKRQVAGVRSVARQRLQQVQPRAEAVQQFFAGVRTAGVNVSIAKALFAAGVRCAEHLQVVDDLDLLQIRGVGPATVRKLRAHFGAS